MYGRFTDRVIHGMRAVAELKTSPPSSTSHVIHGRPAVAQSKRRLRNV